MITSGEAARASCSRRRPPCAQLPLGTAQTWLPCCSVWCIPVPVGSGSWKDYGSGRMGFLLVLASHTSCPPICLVVSSDAVLPLLFLLPFTSDRLSATDSGHIRYSPPGCCSQRLLHLACDFCYPQPFLLPVAALAGPVTLGWEMSAPLPEWFVVKRPIKG